MGDAFSSKKSEQKTTVTNQQVALQGQGNIGISGSSVGQLYVEQSDPEVLKAALNTVNDALQGMGMATQQNAVIAAGAIGANERVSTTAIESNERVVTNSTNRMADISRQALDVANVGILSSGVALGKTLDFLSAAQARSMQTVDDAVHAAQQTALLATPQSPAAYAEINKGQDNKVVIAAGLGILLTVGAVVYLNSRKN